MEYSSVTMCCKVTGGWQILLMNHREDTIGKMKTCQDNNVWHWKFSSNKTLLPWTVNTMMQFRWNMVGQTDASPPTPHHRKWLIDSKIMKQTHFNVSENENVHINSSQFVHCVRSSITTCCIFYPYVGVYNQSNEIYNIQHFWKQLSVLHNIIIITVILSLWTKMVKCSSYQPLVQWCPG